MEYIIIGKDFEEDYLYDNSLIMINKNEGTKKVIMDSATPHFCVLAENNTRKIICLNEKNEICYISKKGTKEKIFVLCKLKKEIFVKMMKLCKSNDGLYLFFSAQYKGDTFLICCFLEENACPTIIEKMHSENFFCFGERVYYQNNDKVLGYRNFKDKKIGNFNFICENANMPSLYNDGQKDYIAYLKNGGIYVNHTLLIEDECAQFPIVERKGREMFLFWKSGYVLEYQSLDTNKKRGRILSNIEPKICCVHSEMGRFYSYNTIYNLTF